MALVVQLAKHLTSRSTVVALPQISIRNFQGENDIQAFLRLRERAFAQQTVGVRKWDEADFYAEMLSKPWWSAERTWFAVTSRTEGREQPIGTVTLAQRGAGPEAQPAIHWLAVDPAWRRRGVAQLLIAYLEAYCWDAGFRRVCLETHTGWTAALDLYEGLGYRPA